MIKVFLVEDEFVIREGIKKNIDWEGHGYQFVGEASDGEIAYPLIKKEKPDIVITDIRMPFMNGLELSKLIKKEMPLTEIIILSGFEEFEYAKEAIKLGVAQYLTKPISGDELLKELDLLSAKIEENKREREIREKYLSEMKEDTVNERKVFFEKLVRAAEPAAKLIQSAEDLNMNLSAVVYSIMLCKAFVHTHSQYEFSQRLVSIEEEIEEYIDEDYVIMFDRDLEGKAFLFKGDSKEQLDRIINEFCEKLKEIFKEYEGIGYFAGIGVYAERLTDITYSYETANKAFTKRYFTDESAIIRIDDISVADLSQEQFNVENLDVKNLDRSKIKEFLKFGDGNETEYFVDEYIQGLGVNAIKSQMFRQYIIMDIYFSVVEFVNTIISDDKEAILEGFKPDLVRTEEESRNYIVSIINKGIEIREGNVSGHNSDVVDRVKKYIEENYADDELSLNRIASHVNFSPNHLSMVFSQQTGNTLIKYLTDFRINKAKEYLKCTNKKSSEISVLVGYKDPHYFSYLFKKTQGVTPTQFREG